MSEDKLKVGSTHVAVFDEGSELPGRYSFKVVRKLRPCGDFCEARTVLWLESQAKGRIYCASVDGKDRWCAAYVMDVECGGDEFILEDVV